MRLAILATLSAAVLAACGGGDASSERLSEEEFREQANAICTDYNEQIADLGSPTSPEDIPDYVERGIPIIQEGIAKLRELNPPEDMADDYDRMLDETEKTIPVARQLSEAAADEDAEAVQEAISLGQEADAESDRIARELGLESCASEE
jgi:ABC-type glycerol-3-phosphate transport system substrate-binding protein